MGNRVPGSLWGRFDLLLPACPPRRYIHLGCRPAADRAALVGIVFVLKTGTELNQLPQDLLGVSGMTYWRRMKNGAEAGVWPAVHEALLAQLRTDGALDLERCAVDGSHVPALKGGIMSGPSPSIAIDPVPSTM